MQKLTLWNSWKQVPTYMLDLWPQLFSKMYFEKSYWISLWEQGTKMLNLVPNLLSKMYNKIIIGSIHDSKASCNCSICDSNFLPNVVWENIEKKFTYMLDLWPQYLSFMCFERSYCISSWEQDTKKAQIGTKLIL